MTKPVLVDEQLLSRLDMLAQARQTNRETLVSDAILAFLAREDSNYLREQINDAYTDDPSDEAAVREETALAHARRRLRRAVVAHG